MNVMQKTCRGSLQVPEIEAGREKHALSYKILVGYFVSNIKSPDPRTDDSVWPCT